MCFSNNQFLLQEVKMSQSRQLKQILLILCDLAIFLQIRQIKIVSSDNQLTLIFFPCAENFKLTSSFVVVKMMFVSANHRDGDFISTLLWCTRLITLHVHESQPRRPQCETRERAGSNWEVAGLILTWVNVTSVSKSSEWSVDWKSAAEMQSPFSSFKETSDLQMCL